MKIRIGFVSNSSSSSFIGCGYEIPNKFDIYDLLFSIIKNNEAYIKIVADYIKKPFDDVHQWFNDSTTRSEFDDILGENGIPELLEWLTDENLLSAMDLWVWSDFYQIILIYSTLEYCDFEPVNIKNIMDWYLDDTKDTRKALKIVEDLTGAEFNVIVGEIEC